MVSLINHHTWLTGSLNYWYHRRHRLSTTGWRISHVSCTCETCFQFLQLDKWPYVDFSSSTQVRLKYSAHVSDVIWSQSGQTVCQSGRFDISFPRTTFLYNRRMIKYGSSLYVIMIWTQAQSASHSWNTVFFNSCT